MIYEGIIQEDGSVKEKSGKVHLLPFRGTDKEGYPEVLIDAKSVGGKGFFQRQSIKPYIGMKVIFERVSENEKEFNHEIIKEQ